MGNYKDRLENLKKTLKLQGMDGVWNKDEYSCAQYNGIEYAVAVMEGREPNYRTVLIDKETNLPIHFSKEEIE